ncbi:MAG: hypothetical protein ChlgKO_06140 [Chlamydiales bacterium]
MDPLRTSASDLHGMLNMERRGHSPALSGEFSDDSQESPKSKIRRGAAQSLNLDDCSNKKELLDVAVKTGNFRAAKRLLNEGIRSDDATQIITDGANFPKEKQIGAIEDACKAYQDLFKIIFPPTEADQEVPDGE